MKNYSKAVYTLLALSMVAVAVFTTPSLSAQANHSAPGAPGGPSIVGGQGAMLGQWPWQAALVYYGESGYTGQFCGGVLISKDWVLTAAHCIEIKDEYNQGHPMLPGELQVLVGMVELSSSTNQRLDIAEIIPHPNFFYSGEEDIALLRLAQPATLGQYTQAAPLISSDRPDLTASGVSAIVSGWGLTTERGLSSDLLQWAEMPIVDNQTCANAYQDEANITDNMLCAGGNFIDSCEGDSGGPLVVADYQSGYVLAGIVSFGPEAGCGTPDTYGVYTRVSSFRDWIISHTGSLVPPPQVIVSRAYLPFTARALTRR